MVSRKDTKAVRGKEMGFSENVSKAWGMGQGGEIREPGMGGVL